MPGCVPPCSRGSRRIRGCRAARRVAACSRRAMHSSNARVTAAFLVRSPLIANARSSSAWSSANVDYILMLVAKYRDERGDGNDTEIRAQIIRAVDASPSLRNKKDLIEAFVASVSVDGEIDAEWEAFVAAKRDAELQQIIVDENLKPDETRAFVDTAFRDGAIRASGTAITRILPPASRFAADGGHSETKQRVLSRLGDYFERFFPLSSTAEP